MSSPAPAAEKQPSPTLVTTRVATYRGKPEGPNAIDDAVDHLAGDLTHNDPELYRMPPQLILLLATADWCTCEGAEHLPRILRQQVLARARFDVPLIGASMARLYCSKEANPDIENGIVCAMLCSRDLRFTIGHLKELDRTNTVNRKRQLRGLAERLEDDARRRLGLGTSADKDLVAFLPGYDKQRHTIDQVLFGEIMECFEQKYALFGASAANSLYSTSGFQFANDVSMQSGLALALVESDLQIGSMLEHGYPASSDVGVDVTEVGDQDESGASNWITSIDGKPAKQRLLELQQSSPGTPFTPVFARPYGSDATLHFATQRIEDLEDDEPAFFAQPVRKGERLYLVRASVEELVKASKSAVDSARRQAGSHPLALLLLFPCASRFRDYEKSGYHWPSLLAEIISAPPGTPAIAGLCAGEFGKDKWRISRGNTLSVLAFAIGNVRNARGLGREYLDRIREATKWVFDASTPAEVMDTALRQAVAAGAEGGQIAIWDRAHNRILGPHHGRSYIAPGSRQNWEEVKKWTDRAAPTLNPISARGIPRELIPHAVQSPWQTGEGAFAKEFIPSDDDDLLGIVVRTRCSIIISDTGKGPQIFHNKRELDEKCNLGPSDTAVYIATPLPGADGEPLGTLQLGFPPITGRLPIDREILTYWDTYGQKVGQTLARAYEQEERDAMNKISAVLTDSITQVDDAEQWTPRQTILKILTIIREQLACWYVSLRLRESDTESAYSLYAEPSPIEALQRAVRPRLTRDEGSCSLKKVKREGDFAGTRTEVEALYEKTKTRSITMGGIERRIPEWHAHLNRVQSDGTVPLWIHEQHEGALVLVSDEPYFFGERKRRIARHAARTIEAFLASHRGAWEKRYRKEQTDRIERAKRELFHELLPRQRSVGVEPDWRPALQAIARGVACEFVAIWIEQLGSGTLVSTSLTDGCRDYGAVERLSDQVSRYREDPELFESYIATRTPPGARWLSGLRSALVLPLRKSDGSVAGLLLCGDRKTGSSPYDLVDAEERRNAEELGGMLGRAIEARDAERLHDELKVRYEQAIRVGAAGLMGSLVIHKLNTGLGVIQGNLDKLLGLKDATAEQHDRWCQNIGEQRAQLQRIVQELVVRPGTPGRRTEELRNLVKLASILARTPNPKKNVTVMVINDIATPVTVSDLWHVVLGIVNVIDNAVDAVSDNGRIEVITSIEEGYGVVRVRNTGDEPSEDVRSRMFMPGYSTKAAGASLGLGLPLARQAFEAADGSIAFDHRNGISEVVMKLTVPTQREKRDKRI